jgi:hypothetical protein
VTLTAHCHVKGARKTGGKLRTFRKIDAHKKKMLSLGLLKVKN